MNKLIKYLVLSLTLILPLCIYLFLEFFGDNKYSIPIYHQEGGAQISECFELSYPHSVDLAKYGISERDSNSPMLLNVVLDSCLNCPPNMNQIRRVRQRHTDLTIMNLYSDAITKLDERTNPSIDWFNIQLPFPDLVSIMRCELLWEIPKSTNVDELRKNKPFALIDGQKRIRGYYGESREEIDRLLVEISILKDSDE